MIAHYVEIPNEEVKTVEDDHTAKIITRLMLKGKVRDAVRWATDREKGEVLDPNLEIIVTQRRLYLKFYARIIRDHQNLQPLCYSV